MARLWIVFGGRAKEFAEKIWSIREKRTKNSKVLRLDN